MSDSTGGESVLEVENIRKTYGGLVAVDGVSFDVSRDEILALIGPNGAGKTTLFNVINGFLDPDDGRVSLNGVDVTDDPPNVHTENGMGRTFQLVRPFGDMTVRENVMVGSFSKVRDAEAAETAAEELIDRFDLNHVADTDASQIPMEQKRYMELARTLATDPDLLLIDEIVAGLSDEEMEDILDIIREINANGTAVILVEHVMDAVMSISDRIIVLADGSLIADGTPDEISTNRQVVEAYLGEEYEAGGGLDA